MKVLVVSVPCLKKDWRSKLWNSAHDSEMEITVLVPYRWNWHGRPISYEKSPGENIKIIRGRAAFSGHINRSFFYTGLVRAMRIRPEIIHMEIEPSGLMALEILILKRIFSFQAKVIFQSSKGLRVRDNLISRLIQKYVFKRTDIVFPVSERGAQFVRKNGFKGKIYIHPNGVTLKEFKKIDASAIKRKLKLAQSFVIGYVGRMVREKGLETLLKACRELEFDYRLLLVGEGNSLVALKRLARELTIDKRLCLLGQKPHHEIPLYLNCMDAMVLPSITQPWWEEYFGMVLIEAMACGVPVIGSTCGAIPSVIDGSGLIFKEGSEKDLAGKIKLLAADIKLRERLIEKGLERVKKNYTWEGIAEQVRQVYRELGHEFRS